MRPLDIAIAGCGIAGLATAVLLRRDGHRVTVFERFEATRPIGSGLMIQPTGLAVLRAIGADADVLAHGARIDRLFGRSGRRGRTVLDVRYAALDRANAFGIGVHRASVFAALYERVEQAGVAIETGRHVIGSTLNAGGRRALMFEDGMSSASFDIVVDTLGARSPLTATPGRSLAYGALWGTLKWPGTPFDPAALQQRYRAASVMAGVLPTGVRPGGTELECAIFWSLRADRLSAWRARGLAAWHDDVAALWPDAGTLFAQIDGPDELTFAHYTHRTLARPAATALIHIGDAWHSTSPQLGQGANMALLDAWALALSLRRSNDIGQALAGTIALRQRHVRLYQAMSVLFTPVYQSDSRTIAALRDWLAAPLSRLWPAPKLLAATVSGLIGDPLNPLDLN